MTALIDVHFKWSDRHGECYDCGLPAAFYSVNCYGLNKHRKLCSVCAANAACDDEKIRYIDEC